MLVVVGALFSGPGCLLSVTVLLKACSFFHTNLVLSANNPY
jgi:hypothetical protein